ncbi:MAG: hypothetical protein JWQ90_1248 [Hydrocarboniphaga sp.]|uniref:hypothetical protein n=1 Tax=Hydrocarboniphaga sp. TaxID=2033016 RepID=UPI002605F0C8|nr:hypothetical protein [Hydrocarboniphaga sp.]MDB5968798.1 hypothetical protein [Hydrocarboniphaga sp.]
MAIGVALLMLVLVSLLILSAVQIAVGEQRSMASDIESQRLNGLAELSLARGFAHLRANANRVSSQQADGWMASGAERWSVCAATQLAPPCGDGSKNIADSRWTAYADVAEARYDSGSGRSKLHYLAPAVTPGSASPRQDVVQIIGEAVSADGRGHAVVRQDALIHPLIEQWPEATIVAGSVRLAGSGRILSGALSIWSSGDTRLEDASLSCAASELVASACGMTLSDASHENADILDVDGNQGANRDSAVAPGDIFERVFGVAAQLWPSLRDQMQSVDSCGSLGPDTRGAIWIAGDCIFSPGVVIGSITTPLVLVIENGRLIADGNAVSGLVMLFSHDGGNSSFVPSNGASIAGALLANAALEITAGSYRVWPDAAVASALQSGAAAPLLLTPVPGSWRDY